MWSDRLPKQIEALSKFTARFGVVAITFNQATCSFRHEPKLDKKVRINYLLLIIEMVVGLLAVLKLRWHGDLNQFNLSLAYWCGSIMDKFPPAFYAAVMLTVTFFVAGHFAFCLLTNVHLKNCREMANLFNAMVKFEDIHAHQLNDLQTKKSSKINKTNFLLINTTFNVMVAHAAHYLGSLGNPCTPHLVGYLLVPECQSEVHNADFDYKNFAIKFFVAFLNWLVLSTYYFTVNAEAVIFSYLSGASFVRFMELLRM
ncbi:unnamed protein product [Orchesella dallaii]|uniref:Uncharacterized protein n=1 Tax=Orchesella dallaii TaxID=48710 RepID=A0ABP1RAI9_9HEXA